MRRFSFLILFTLFTLSSYSQDITVENDGYKVYKFPNGAVSSEGFMKNGKPDGYWKSYYVTGVKKSEGKRTNFLLDSIWIFYDQSGDTLEKISYLGGKKNGWYQIFKREPGKGLYVFSKELFAGDKKEGTGYTYFPDGKILTVVKYDNGQKDGLSRIYNNEGDVIELLEYKNDFLVSREKINRTDNKGQKQGEWIDFYPAGLIKKEMSFRDNQLNGYYKEFDEKGKLILIQLYQNGAIVKSGNDGEENIEIVNRYDANGKLIYNGPYKNNIPVGVHRDYDANGRIINSKIYNDNGQKLYEGIVDDAGKWNGKFKEFDLKGNIDAEGQYNDSKRTGFWKFYDDNGKILQSGNYNAGRPDGLWKWFYENGNILREEEYFQGNRDGAYTEFDINGNIICQGKFIDGEKDGEWKTKIGDSVEEGKFISGMKDGEWKTSITDGKVLYKGNFVQGNADGVHEYFYENGLPREQQFYRMGIKQKTWKKYNEDGTIFLSITYKDDVETSINGIKIKLLKEEGN